MHFTIRQEKQPLKSYIKASKEAFAIFFLLENMPFENTSNQFSQKRI